MISAPLTSVLTGVGSIGMFSSRAFVSAFAVAAVLKWGPQISWISDTGLLQRITDTPTWFTHDITLIVLGILATLEIIATKSPEARELLNEVDGYLKTGSAFISTLTVAGILTADDAALLQQVSSALEPVYAGSGDQTLGYLSAGLAAGGVWFASVARARILRIFIEADPDDDTMVVGLLSWAEDLWALLGTLLLFIFPLVMLGITAALLIGLWLLQWRARRKEEQSKTTCTKCEQSMYRSAMRCPHCNNTNDTLYGIGWLGQTTDAPATNPAQQPELLTQKQRCPSCATYLKARKTRQNCPACDYALFKNQDDVKRYLAVIDGRLGLVLLISGLLSLIPLVGLIPGIILYRIKLVAPLRRYTRMTRTIPVRWGLRLVFFVLIWFQLTPGFGAFAVPLMALMSYGAYRAMFLKQLKRDRQSAGDSP